MKMILGVDVGGVIIDGVKNDGTDTSFFGKNYLKTSAVPGVFEALAFLRPRFDDIYIVSKCGEHIQKKTREWLAHQDFYGRTEILEENIRFCLERPEKAPLCESLGITHFVDDKLEVLSYLHSVPHRYAFQSQVQEEQEYSSLLPFVTRVQSWAELREKILESF